MEDFQDESMIVKVVLQLITLFTAERESSSKLFDNERILKYVFSRLKGEHIDTMGDKADEVIKLASYALCRLSSRFEATQPSANSQKYI